MKSKLVLHQSALVFTCCTALILLLMNNELLAQRKQRPNPADAVLKIEPLSPELENILKNWENESKKIKKLQGNHKRLWYDDVFQLEKRSEGKFYYEQPDKGAIVITGMEIEKGQVSDKRNAKGKPFQLKSGENERWVCDGKRIFSIDEEKKTYEVFPIPLNRRGANIMEGPLPFLFGMPAATAKKRYFLKLLVNTPQQIIIAVKPRRPADAANYSEAKVLLNPKTYIPGAVQLIHPGGNQSTVYRFENVVANKNRSLISVWFGKDKDPFRPDLDDYQLQGKVVAAAAEDKNVQKPVQQMAAFKVPSMIGRDYETAQKMLKKMGFTSTVHPGDPAKNPGERKFHVYKQKPQAGAPAKKGETVHLLLYTDPKSSKK